MSSESLSTWRSYCLCKASSVTAVAEASAAKKMAAAASAPQGDLLATLAGAPQGYLLATLAGARVDLSMFSPIERDEICTKRVIIIAESNPRKSRIYGASSVAYRTRFAGTRGGLRPGEQDSRRRHRDDSGGAGG